MAKPVDVEVRLSGKWLHEHTPFKAKDALTNVWEFKGTRYALTHNYEKGHLLTMVDVESTTTMLMGINITAKDQFRHLMYGLTYQAMFLEIGKE